MGTNYRRGIFRIKIVVSVVLPVAIALYLWHTRNEPVANDSWIGILLSESSLEILFFPLIHAVKFAESVTGRWAPGAKIAASVVYGVFVCVAGFWLGCWLIEKIGRWIIRGFSGVESSPETDR